MLYEKKIILTVSVGFFIIFLNFTTEVFIPLLSPNISSKYRIDISWLCFFTIVTVTWFITCNIIIWCFHRQFLSNKRFFNDFIFVYEVIYYIFKCLHKSKSIHKSSLSCYLIAKTDTEKNDGTLLTNQGLTFDIFLCNGKAITYSYYPPDPKCILIL